MKEFSKKSKNKKVKINFSEKKPLFSNKEIIFRSQGRAKAFHISSKAQVIFLSIMMFIAVWTLYSYYIYNKSGTIISIKDKELGETRDAYVDLMTDFVALHKNIVSVINSIDNNNAKDNHELELYRSQALVVEDRIKQITEEVDWADTGIINEKANISEALLQRDIATSERDVLKKQLNDLVKDVDEIKRIEFEVLKKVEEVAGSEVTKIKNAISAINKPLKSKSLYFNPLANKKTGDKGGPYIPAPNKIKDKKLNDKLNSAMTNLEDWEYYKEVVKYVPIGKPVWSYWISSKFGARNDPFKNSQAVHKGIDLASRTGNKVKTMANGKVKKAEMNRTYGNLIVIDHGNGFETKYAHLHKMYIKKGDFVEAEDVIGEVGSTGRSTGPHLHYEILYRGHPVDPLPFIKTKI